MPHHTKTRVKSTAKTLKRQLIAVMVIGSTVGIGTFLWQHPYLFVQQAQIAQITGGTGTIALSLNPTSTTTAAGSTTAFTLTLNTGSSKVSAVQVELTYGDNCVLPTVTQGNFLGTVLSPAKVTGGKINFTYAVAPDSGGKQGTGTIATIQTGPKSGSCQLSFTNNTQAAAIGKDTNAVSSASDATVSIVGFSPAPSPSPTVKATTKPTTKPTSTPTATPTQSAGAATTGSINALTPAASFVPLAPQVASSPMSSPETTAIPSEKPSNFFVELLTSWVNGMKQIFGIHQ